jgi:type IV secretion system protein VirB2
MASGTALRGRLRRRARPATLIGFCKGEEVMLQRIARTLARALSPAAAALALSLALALALLQPAFSQSSTSPFLTGATALETNILAWLTPIAIILVMVLGAMAMANRISWAWCVGAILGIAIAFGAPQIVSWVRGMFGV